MLVNLGVYKCVCVCVCVCVLYLSLPLEQLGVMAGCCLQHVPPTGPSRKLQSPAHGYGLLVTLKYDTLQGVCLVIYSEL